MITDLDPKESFIEAARAEVRSAGEVVLDLSIEDGSRGHEAYTEPVAPVQDIPRIPYDHKVVEIAAIEPEDTSMVSPENVLSISRRIAGELSWLRGDRAA